MDGRSDGLVDDRWMTIKQMGECVDILMPREKDRQMYGVMDG